jgi:DSF synthase
MGSVLPQVLLDNTSWRQIFTRFDSQYGALWCIFDPKPRACFTFEVLEEIRRFQNYVERLAENGANGAQDIRFVILASRSPGVFNFGGDLALFSRCVREKDSETLRKYAKACIDVLYPHAVGFHLPLTTISLVQGDALGGGFEAAMASDVLIAERSAQFGFPEVLFNLFPGMGAYNLLERRVGMLRAEQMLLNGKLYRAEELHAAGVVDLLAEDGHGENALYDYIVRNDGRRTAVESLFRVRRRIRPIRYEDLLDVLDIWVDAAMRIAARELRLMDRLARSQERTHGDAAKPFGAGAEGRKLHPLA